MGTEYTHSVSYDGSTIYRTRSGKYHRENGPAYINSSGYKEWWLEGVIVFASWEGKLILRNKIILSKEQHPKYSTVQIWRCIDENGIQEQIIIPGMEAWILE